MSAPNQKLLPAPYPKIFDNENDFYRFLLGLYDRTGGQTKSKMLTDNGNNAVVDFSDKLKFLQHDTTGTSSANLGANSPVTVLTPYAWIDVRAPDGTLCTMPIWKKK
jgi:hypothetical protein